jgi:hypothetical protein
MKYDGLNPALARQLIDRDAFLESRIDELEDALPNHRRQSTAHSRHERLATPAT